MISGRDRTGRTNPDDGRGDRLGPAERAADVLARRALELARRPEPIPEAGRVLVVVCFKVGGERFAVEARHVRRVERLSEPTPVPGTPGHLIGVVNFRGEVLAVFDPRQLVGEGGPAGPTPALVVVLGHERDEFGLGADEASEVYSLPGESVLDPPETPDLAGRASILGATADATIILDGAELLRDERLLIDID